MRIRSCVAGGLGSLGGRCPSRRCLSAARLASLPQLLSFPLLRFSEVLRGSQRLRGIQNLTSRPQGSRSRPRVISLGPCYPISGRVLPGSRARGWTQPEVDGTAWSRGAPSGGPGGPCSPLAAPCEVSGCLFLQDLEAVLEVRGGSLIIRARGGNQSLL